MPDLLDHRSKKFDYSFQLYEELVESWIERESGWIDREILRGLSEDLAIDLYNNRKQRGSERLSKSELVKLIKLQKVSLEDWKITGRSLLNRDALGNLKFAHRSIMEHLYIKRLAIGDPRCIGVDLTDNMKRFLIERIHAAYSAPNHPLPTFTSIQLAGAPRLNIKPLYELRATSKVISDMNKELKREGLLSGGIRFLYSHIYAAHEQNEVNFVIDYATGLQWQQGGSELPLIQESAEQYIWRMNDTKFGGYKGWRLPTLIEVLALLEDELAETGVNQAFDNEITSFWTSDSYSGSDGHVVVVLNEPASIGGEGRTHLLSFTTSKGQCSIYVIPKYSNFTAHLRAVRTIYQPSLKSEDDMSALAY